jgi:NADPH:quinone reductase-like Zn-dependent oxidoreductase
MSAPASIKQWVVTDDKNGFEGLQLQDAQTPKVGDNDVLIKVHGASLNYRDLAIARVSDLVPVLHWCYS